MSRTLLVIEDEPSLRRLLVHALRREGYEVMDAEVAENAMKLWEANRDRIDLIISDIVMPGGLNGWELAKAFWRDCPTVKVLFMSGYFGDLPAPGELDVNEKNFLRKPFLPTDLIARVRSLLAG